MITAGATLTIRRIPLCNLTVNALIGTEIEPCYPEKFVIYLNQLTKHPDKDLDPLIVLAGELPSMFCIVNGKHRYCASIIAGRKDVLCVVVEEPGQESEEEHDATTDDETQETPGNITRFR